MYNTVRFKSIILLRSCDIFKCPIAFKKSLNTSWDGERNMKEILKCFFIQLKSLSFSSYVEQDFVRGWRVNNVFGNDKLHAFSGAFHREVTSAWRLRIGFGKKSSIFERMSKIRAISNKKVKELILYKKRRAETCDRSTKGSVNILNWLPAILQSILNFYSA